jgi:chromatin segregation and condensation protein Rec8/ScpA/Scc1 (kleisin family)
MTPEERTRMNELCARIQEERDYKNFSALLHEMSELIERKEQRRFPDQPKVVWARNKPWISMPATAIKILSAIGRPKPKVEVSIAGADDLFREIRIENQFTGMDGKPVALTTGARWTVTLEAEMSGTVPDTNSV